jgi:isocitrate/isopropylmalate dehydrogenase
MRFGRMRRAAGEGKLPQCKSCGAILLGAVSGPKWDAVRREIRPKEAFELRSAIQPLRKTAARADLRRAVAASPLKAERSRADLIFFLCGGEGGIYSACTSGRWATRGRAHGRVEVQRARNRTHRPQAFETAPQAQKKDHEHRQGKRA